MIVQFSCLFLRAKIPNATAKPLIRPMLPRGFSGITNTGASEFSGFSEGRLSGVATAADGWLLRFRTNVIIIPTKMRTIIADSISFLLDIQGHYSMMLSPI